MNPEAGSIRVKPDAVAEMLGDEKVDLIISGRFGDKMKGVLDSKNMKYKEISGMTIKEVLTKVE